MAKKLTKKQADLLCQFTHEELLELIHAMLEHNPDAHEYVMLHYLLSPEEKLKNIEKEYKKQQRKKGNYDYWKSHEFFIELDKSIAQPLNQLALTLADETIRLSTQLIVDFESFTQKYDTSSGSWQDYLHGLLSAWLKALGTAFKNNSAFDIVTPYFAVKTNCEWFPVNLVQSNKKYFPLEAIHSIRDAAFAAGDVEHALALSFILKDFAYLKAAYDHNRLGSPSTCLQYAHILLEDFQTAQAVTILQEMKLTPQPHNLQSKIDILLVQAVYENGDTQQALKLCKDGFSRGLNAEFYKKFIKYHPEISPTDSEAFYQIAYRHGAAAYLNFAAEIQDWTAFDQLIRAEIADADDRCLAQLEKIQSVSNIRKWSTALAQHGFPVSAICIRRKLMLSTLAHGKSTYYKYAISDLKKSLDFMQALKEEDQKLIPSADDFIHALYAQHGRKYSFWAECVGLVPSQFLP